MSKVLPLYQDLVPNYPTSKDAVAVRAAIGGAVDKSWYENTCIMRVSKAMNYANHPIPPDTAIFKTRKGADGKWYGLGVQQFWEYLEKNYGKPTVYAEKDKATGRIPYDKFKGYQGIIGFRVKGWKDASGHFTLFDGFNLLYGGDAHNYWEISFKAGLWRAGANFVTSPDV
ncbi:MAG: T6SS effector amidase Tae4 family protein [Pyrinomonadaceae bacterium]